MWNFLIVLIIIITNFKGGRGVDRNNAGGETSLPTLQGGNPGQYQGRRNVNNNHYRNSDGKKYRGGQNRGHKPS